MIQPSNCQLRVMSGKRCGWYWMLPHTHQEVVEVVSDQQDLANPFLSMFGLVQADLAQLDDRALNSRSYLCRCRKWHHCIHCDPTGFGS